MFQILSIILSFFGFFGFDEWDFAVLMWHMLMLQMIMLEGAKATTETVDALRTGAAAMKAMQKATYVALYCCIKHISTFTRIFFLIICFTFYVSSSFLGCHMTSE